MLTIILLWLFVSFLIAIPLGIGQSIYKGDPVRAVLLNTYKNKNVYEVYYKRGNSVVYTVSMGSKVDRKLKELC